MNKQQLKEYKTKMKDYRTLLAVYMITATYLYLGGVNDSFVVTNPDGPALLLFSFITLIMSLIFGLNIHILNQKIKRMRSK